MDESSESRHGVILGRYILIYLVLDLKSPKLVIAGGDRPYRGRTGPTIDMQLVVN